MNEAALIAAANEGARAAARRIRMPKHRPGTVQSVDTSGAVAQVLLDADSAAIPAHIVGAWPKVNDRVMVYLQPPHGALIVGFVGGAPIPRMDTLELIDDASSLAWEQWGVPGTHEATITDPGESSGTAVLACTGEVENTNTGTVFYGLRLVLSLDGGTTTTTFHGGAYVIAGSRDYPLARSAHLAGTPSGDIQGYAEFFQSFGSAGDLVYREGHLKLEWWPD